MKYIIFLVVITIVIVAYVKFDKSDNPSSNNKSDEIFSDSWIDHNQVIWENNESEDIVGCPLPSDISKLSCHAGFFSDLEITDDAVFQGADCGDGTGGFTEHFLGNKADRFAVIENLIGSSADGNNGGFVQNDSLVADTDQRVACAEVNPHILAEPTQNRVQYHF